MDENGEVHQDSVTIRFTLTDEDIREADSLKYSFLHPISKIYSILLGLGLCALGILVSLLGGWWIVITVVCLLLGLLTILDAIIRYLDSHPRGVGMNAVSRYEYELSDAGMHYRIDLRDINLTTWGTLYKVIESNDLIVLLAQMYSSAIIFPKRAFSSPEQLELARDIIHRNVGRPVKEGLLTTSSSFEPIVLKFTLTKRDISLAFRKHCGSVADWAAYSMIGLLVFIEGVMIFVVFPALGWKAMIPMVFWGILGIGWIVTFRARSKVRRQHDYLIGKQILCELSTTGVRIFFDEGDQRDLHWSAFRRWSESSRFFVLHESADNRLVILAKWAVADKTGMDRIRTILNQRIINN